MLKVLAAGTPAMAGRSMPERATRGWRMGFARKRVVEPRAATRRMEADIFGDWRDSITRGGTAEGEKGTDADVGLFAGGLCDVGEGFFYFFCARSYGRFVRD